MASHVNRLPSPNVSTRPVPVRPQSVSSIETAKQYCGFKCTASEPAPAESSNLASWVLSARMRYSGIRLLQNEILVYKIYFYKRNRPSPRQRAASAAKHGEKLERRLHMKSYLIAAVLAGPAMLFSATSTDGDRITWFREAKFGMFIHWGPYSLASVEASWPIMRPKPGGIREAEYRNLAN